MKILVCIKQVPDAVELKFDPVKKTIVRDGVRGIVNPFDRGALSLGVHLKQRFGAHVTAVTMGPPAAREVLYEALAAGCDRAVHLCDAALAGSDTLATARALAALARQDGGYTLIACGKHTIDGETAQVGPELAELLGIPHMASVHHLEWTRDEHGAPAQVVARCESDDGEDTIKSPLPCLLTTAEHLLPPAPIPSDALQAARAQPIEVRTAADLGLTADAIGTAGSPTWVAEIRHLPPPPRPPVQLLSGTPQETAAALVRAIREALGESATVPEPLPPASARSPIAERAVWVVVQCGADGALLAGSRELLGEAAVLTSQLGGEVVAVVLGPSPASLPDACAAYGANAVLHIEHPGLVEYSNEVQGAALCAALKGRAPFAVLFCATERGRDLAPRVAARLQAGLVGDAIGLSLDAQGRFLMLKPAFSGAIVAPILSRTMPQLVTVRPGVLAARAPDSSRRPRIERWTPTDLPQSRTRLLHHETTLDEQAAHLLSARMVVGVGMGIGDPRHIPTLRTLAEAFQGALCATRRVTDKGWMPRQLQVGLTGKVIAPQVYLAVGIRGVPYHAIGIQRAVTILAINQDPKAQIFKYARYGVVADWSQIVPAMLNELGH